MGLLDGLLGDSFEDPRTVGLLSLVQSLTSNRRPLQGLSGGLLGYSQALAQGKQAKQQEELKRMQLEQMQMAQAQQKRQMEQQALQDQFRASIPSPLGLAQQQALGGGGGPTQANAAQMPAIDPNAQLLHGALQAGLIDPVQYLNAQRKDTTPTISKPGDIARDAKGNIVWQNPAADANTDTSGLKEYRFAREQGYKGSFLQFQLEQKRAGATNVSVNTAKPFLNEVAQGLGKQIDASLENARAAIPAIQTAQSLKSAVDSGKLVSGPGANFRVLGLQLGQQLGIGGASGAEVLSNTRQAIQSMAQAELNAAAQMKGQGQITESERSIIRRAASGSIDELTGPEIRQLADVMEKTARFKISQHKQNVGRLKNMPEAAPLVQFYDVEEPGAYSPQGGAKVRRYNPETGRIE